MPRSFQIQAEPGKWRWSWPMGLTTLRLLLLPFFLYLLLMDARKPFPHPHRYQALVVFAIMAATDKLDGYLARKLNQSTKLRAILDPLADKLLVASSVVLLSFDWVVGDAYTIPFYVIVAVYGKDVIVALGTMALVMAVGNVTVQARPAGKLSTFLQIALILATLLAPDLDRLRPNLAPPILKYLCVSVSGISAIACVDYLVQGVKAFRQARRLAASESSTPRPSGV